MSAGRRGSLLSAAFALLALGLTLGGRAHAQPVIMQRGGGFNGFDEPGAGRHTIWNRQLNPGQVRDLFERFNKGDPAAAKQFEDMLRGPLQKQFPGMDPKQLDALAKEAMKHPEFRERFADALQKHKNQNPNRDPDAPPDPRALNRDLERIRDALRQSGKGDPFQPPPPDPKRLPKFDPESFDPNNFDPKRFPHADPDNPPKIDPESRLPLDPKTNRPFDPRTGGPLDPQTGEPPERKAPKLFTPDNPGAKGDPAPKGEPPPPPKDAPNAGRPGDPDRPPEPEGRLGPPKQTPEQMAKAKAYDTATAMWEKNVGPIDETPAVKKAIYDLISDPEAMDALTDGKGNSLFDMFKDGMGDNDGFKGLFDGADGPGWEWPKLDWKMDWGKNSNLDFGASAPKTRWPEGGSRWPSGGGSSFGSGWGGGFNFGGVQVPWVLALLVLALIVAAVVWWKWDAIAQLRSGGAPPPGGLGPWPLDPHEINTREDVVKAFEYLSVLICGPAAKTWTHSTVADELAALARTHGETAVKLARLYELARYAPLDEPLSRAELLEARRLVCDLAGVD